MTSHRTATGHAPHPQPGKRPGGRGHKVFQTNLESSELGIVAIDGYGFIVAINSLLLELLGFQEQELIDKPLRLLFPDLDDVPEGGTFRQVLETARQHSRDGFLSGVSVDGTASKFDVWIFDSASHLGHLTLCCRDVTPQADLQDTLHRHKEMLRALYTQVADAILLVDQRGYLEDLNPVAAEMLGLGHRRHGNVYLGDVLHLKDSEGNLVNPVGDALGRERTVNRVADIALELADTAVPVMVSATPIRDRNSHIVGCVIVMRAVSESRRVSTRLSWHETHDPLTQLTNRRQLENEVLLAVDDARVENSRHALLYIDLYNFSMINDTCGHAAGDELLRHCARLLTQVVGDHDVVARSGNDEFAILLWGRSDEQARCAAEAVLAAIVGFSLPWRERRLKVGASIGVAMIDRDSESETGILLAARASCGVARDSGRNRIHIPSHSLGHQSRHSLSRWAASISDALDENRFVVYCQPIVPLQNDGLGRHCEALVRMLDRDGKIIPPGKFIPAAESSGLIDDIDKWVFDKVLNTLEALPAERARQLAISVNLSGNTISDEHFLGYVTGRLREVRLEPGVLHFEITETAAIKHFDRAIQFIRALNELGCKFALDDFGSGLSSFGYLKQLPVDYLKIDGSFVCTMEQQDVEYSMVSTINHLAHIMGLSTIAEGVENPEQLAMLKAMGVDYGQGFYIAAPEPMERLLLGS